jgi:SecD/SecF fusion protein
MQSKGIIKFFLVVMLLVTAVQYLYVIPTNQVEGDAEDYALDLTGETEGEDFRQAYAAYLDSMSNQEVFKLPLFSSANLPRP